MCQPDTVFIDMDIFNKYTNTTAIELAVESNLIFSKECWQCQKTSLSENHYKELQNIKTSCIDIIKREFDQTVDNTYVYKTHSGYRIRLKCYHVNCPSKWYATVNIVDNCNIIFFRCDNPCKHMRKI